MHGQTDACSIFHDPDPRCRPQISKIIQEKSVHRPVHPDQGTSNARLKFLAQTKDLPHGVEKPLPTRNHDEETSISGRRRIRFLELQFVTPPGLDDDFLAA